MKYSEFTDKVKLILDEVNWSMVGKLTTTYKLEFLSDCLDKIKPENVKNFTPKDKTGYFVAIVRKNAKPSDCKSSIGKRFFDV